MAPLGVLVDNSEEKHITYLIKDVFLEMLQKNAAFLFYFKLSPYLCHANI